MPVTSPFLVSAPGKVILFGEHSAVYCKPAIAAALSLRTYLLVTPSQDPDVVALEFPDIKFSHKWNRNDLPWNVLNNVVGEKPVLTEELVPELVSALANNLDSIASSLHYSAAYTFLYLYMSLCHKNTQGVTISVRSTLPIGAGLGSSASIAVCIATALALLGEHISPALVRNEKLTVETQEAAFIENWSFMGEKCIHGTPSGIDNAVATHGGAVMFQKTNSSLPSVRTTMRNFPSLKLILTNTTQPRRTADLVAGVSRLNNEFPKTTTAILNAMESLTHEAYNLMIKPFDKEAKDTLRKLVCINHGLLVAIGVSHPKLEKVKMLADEMAIGQTKLTGAGGGGCAITLLNDEVSEENIEKLTLLYKEEGFETYETTLGGKGVGVLIPEEDRAESEIFSVKQFLEFSSRDQIEQTVGVTNLHGWRYW
ncbi:hypothetical protein BABINDRAFT_29989 [Babjeviella inositovora NRRL Y-12698]|uniref:Mevalonate kinase n=1 Tax=Babjeviella inositovora NRRL Y-12698 TaxID=984486 RepID=A0A1E3QY88_9ASCO|nr:uncharacterized protein BABINDRAFT_29989 [Babjeviella inositovora NRRL Y-12698]ODQ82623.1 hypothetical protein BABINDRAFT_29989 [Babjeviella inositovora NRRL Y-12698]